MKQVILSFALLLTLASCTGGKSNQNNENVNMYTTEEKTKEVAGRKNFGADRALVTTPQPCVMIATWDGHPSTPQMKDIGILASTDPVALDKACLDLMFNHQNTSGDNASPLVSRIESLHGTHTVSYAEQLGLGSQQYTLIALSDVSSVTGTHAGSALRYNVYSLDGKKLLTNAPSLDALTKGTYIINGQKRIIE